ncbi:Signal peptide peptidase-like 2A [Desmophyllum pertusum]|uniref:Signal peptide peptidase-like 2A n=1 Tax=Desmophyllum pertusum TaxID=174260 RepID=A0A9W9ZK80_9CNID|nr:Signal peptide peptidase-like 2A [Desmophyllum pertusum]
MVEVTCCSCFVFLVVFITFTSQGYGQDVGNLGVLHVSKGTESQDFCIAYNANWTSIPADLDNTPKYSLVEAKPSALCQNPTGVMIGAAVAEVIIISNDTLFTPDANSSDDYAKAYIPLAVISQQDWIKLKDFGSDVKVQLYAPQTGLSGIDGNLAVLWLVAVGTVAVGAYWAGITNKKKMQRDLQRGNTSANGEEDEANRQDQASEDDSVEVTPLMVVAFVVLICGTLLLLYYFYDYLVYVVIVLFCLASCNGLYECLHPIVLWLPLGNCKVPPTQFQC